MPPIEIYHIYGLINKLDAINYQVFLRERQAMNIGATKMAVNNAGIAIDNISTESDMVVTLKFQTSDHELSLPVLSRAFTRQ